MALLSACKDHSIIFPAYPNSTRPGRLFRRAGWGLRLLVFSITGFPALAPAAPEIHVAQTEVDLGYVLSGRAVLRLVSIENHGDAPLIISAVKSSCTSCTGAVARSRVIPPQGKRDLEITFFARSSAGPQQHTLSIYSNDPHLNPLDISVSATVFEVDSSEHDLELAKFVEQSENKKILTWDSLRPRVQRWLRNRKNIPAIAEIGRAYFRQDFFLHEVSPGDELDLSALLSPREKPDKALDFFAKKVLANPSLWPNRFLVDFLEQMDETSGLEVTIEFLNAALKHSQNSSTRYRLRMRQADLYLKHERWADAVGVYEELWKNFPDSFHADDDLFDPYHWEPGRHAAHRVWRFAWALAHTGNIERTLAVAQKGIQQFPAVRWMRWGDILFPLAQDALNTNQQNLARKIYQMMQSTMFTGPDKQAAQQKLAALSDPPKDGN